MKDFYFRVATPDEWQGLGMDRVPGDVEVDIVGPLSKVIEISVLGVVKASLVAIDGWHVNVRSRSGTVPARMELFEVVPVTPARVWL